MGMIRTTGALMMIGVFTIAILGFVIQFASDNSAAVDISNDADIYNLYSKTNSNVSAFRDDASNTYTSLIKSTVEEGGSTAPSTGPFALTPLNAIGTVKNIMTVGYHKIFGSGGSFGIFLTTITAFLGFILAFYAYKALRGIPD